MAPSNQPRLRRHVVKEGDADNPRLCRLVDLLGLAPALRLSAEELGWLDVLNGASNSADLPADERDRLAVFVRRLDESLFLEGPRFRQIVDGQVRPPRCVGCYEEDPDQLRRQLTRMFTAPGGPGLPGAYRSGGKLRAALIPHIDFARGGVGYGWGFKEVAERADASLFVIIGTSHYSQQRFTLTRKHFQTPLGIALTDQDYVGRLAGHFGPGLFDDEWLAHLPEHSIELEVVFLQFLYEKKRPIRIVPLVVGSFYDCVSGGVQPLVRPDIARMLEALRRAEADTPEPICYIISGDLAHIGPKFQTAELDTSILEHSRRQDLAILRSAEAAAPADYFRIIAAEADSRNICGLPPTYTFLEALRPRRGKLLHYDQHVHPLGQESVSFASMAFYGG
jgi:AmmeMemoRadiSam system protein B